MYSTDHQTLQDLEFSAIKSWLETFCIGPTATKKVQLLQPRNQFQLLRQELSALDELRQVRVHGEKFPVLEFEELQKEIKLLGIQKAVISLEGFRRIYTASELVNAIVLFLKILFSSTPCSKSSPKRYIIPKRLPTRLIRFLIAMGKSKMMPLAT